MFTLDHRTLERLTASFSYELGDDDCVLFGLRGCLPTNRPDRQLGDAKPLRSVPTDHLSMRCTLGVWIRGQRQVLAVPGSTVPHKKHVQRAVSAGGVGANQVLPSLLAFEKGFHPRSAASGQQLAFVQAADFPYQRTADDLDFDGDDPIVVGRPGDNIHCAYQDTPDLPGFDSAGCFVVAGRAKRSGMPNTKDIGCWPHFRDRAIESGQTSFRFLLANGSEAEAAATAPPGTLPVRLRFGSRGPAVKQMQDVLVKQHLLARTDASGVFGPRTLRAVSEAQRLAYLTQDGTCGLNTADALGISPWPCV